MEALEIDTGMSLEEKEKKIRLAFDRARKDIAVVQAKIECKKEEVSLLEVQQGGGSMPYASGIPPSTGNVVMTGHPSENLSEEYGHLK